MESPSDMPREPFILTKPPDNDGFLHVEGGEADHLYRTLRAGPGFRITGFDGDGNGWLAEVVSVQRGELKCRVLETLPEESEPKPRLQVGVGVVKGSYMDQAVEKAAEVGAAAFTPLLTDYSVVKPGDGKIRRWRSIALASAKQSRRLRLMKICLPVTLKEFVDLSLREDAVWAMHNSPETQPLVKHYQESDIPSILTLLIGPEGGFSASEVEMFKESKVVLVNLGTRPLRTETAVTVALGTLINLLHK